jgi:integrase
MRGTILELKPAKPNSPKFAVVLYGGIDPVTKKEKRIWKRFQTRKEAERYCSKAAHQLMNGQSIPSSKLTVKEFLEKWLEDYCKGSLSQTSQARYESIVNTHLVPTFGQHQLIKLSPQIIQGFLSTKLAEKKLSPTTIVLIFSVLHRALESALKWELVMRNVCDAVEIPREAQFEPKILDSEQTRLFLAEAKRSSRFYPIMLTGVLTGMRLGEIVGLRWSDIDFLGMTVTINQAASYLHGEWQFTSPKTKKSRRTISIPQSLVDALKELKKDSSSDLVFATPTGTPVGHVPLLRDLRRTLKKVGLPRLRFHDLRHCHATLLLQQGVHPKIVSERLGHSNIAMTMDTYSHVIPGMQTTAMDDLEKRLFGNQQAGR